MSKECWFPTLPCESDLWDQVGVYCLFDIRLKYIVRHMEPALRVECFFGEVETVPAGKVTLGTARFCHKVECREFRERFHKYVCVSLSKKINELLLRRQDFQKISVLIPHEPGIDFFFMIDVMVPAHIHNHLFDNPSGKQEGGGIIR